jgi:hypothetical protein
VLLLSGKTILVVYNEKKVAMKTFLEFRGWDVASLMFK